MQAGKFPKMNKNVLHVYQLDQSTPCNSRFPWCSSDIIFLGELPMSGLDLVNDSERQQFLPTTKQLVKLMEKDYLNAIEMNTLLDDSEKLTDIITEAFIGQFG